jgi:hypothetical protein
MSLVNFILRSFYFAPLPAGRLPKYIISVYR